MTTTKRAEEIPAAAPDRAAREAALLEALDERILVLDGATGTALQAFDLAAEDFGGAAYEGCNEFLCVTRPDVVRGVSERYLRAGCDVVETNSFGGTPLVLAEYGLADRAFEQVPDCGAAQYHHEVAHPAKPERALAG